MSSKKLNMDPKNKGSQCRKNRRRSTRNVSISNGDDDKERSSKRARDLNLKDNFETAEQSQDLYKGVINLLPLAELNCSPDEAPAPPGTHVNLHGVILHETPGGLIVLNVRWRNKIYSGALIDVEKNRWATERIQTDNQQENKQFQVPPPIKKIKIPAASSEESDSSKRKTATSPTASKNVKIFRNNGKKRGSQDVISPTPTEETTPTKKNKVIFQNGDTSFECSEPNCGKRYKNKNGLSYHRRTMHSKTSSKKNEFFDDSGKENKSEESDSGDDNFVIDEKADEGEGKEDDIESKDGEIEEKSNTLDEQNGSQSEECDDEKKEEMTENERHIEKLKLEIEKGHAALRNIKQENGDGDNKRAENVDTFKADATGNEQLSNKNPVDIVESTPEVVVSEPKLKKEVKLEVKQIPSLHIEPSIAMDVKKESLKIEEDDHPRGSSRTIFHEDRANSLNELFAPAQNFPQYSPTLVSLDPQQINESLTEALSKQQKTTITTVPLTKIENSDTTKNISTLTKTFDSKKNVETHDEVAKHTEGQHIVKRIESNDQLHQNSEQVKNVLAFKPSAEIKLYNVKANDVTKSMLTSKTSYEIQRFNTFDQAINQSINQAENKFQLMNAEYIHRQNNELIECSDDDRSISPENALAFCQKTYPQDDRNTNSLQPKSNMSITLSKHNNMFPIMQLGQPATAKSFENRLLLKELANKCSNAAATINSLQVRLPNAAIQQLSLPNKSLLQDLSQFSNIDPKNLPPNVLNYIKPMNFANNMKGIFPSTSSTSENRDVKVDQNSEVNSSPLKPTTLLEQMLLEKTVRSETVPTSQTSASILGKIYLPPNISAGVPPLRQDVSNPDIVISNNSVVASYADHVPAEKNKTTASSLRINPPISVEDRLSTGSAWIPSDIAVKEGQQSTPSTFRKPAAKTIPVNNIRMYQTSISPQDNRTSKLVMKRSISQPIAIAPAPISSVQVARSEIVNEYSDVDKEQPQMSRFTLTSDNRLIPSPIENRGRPRKIRVEKTQQVPIGTAQEIAKTRAIESPLGQKLSSSPVIRTSVIQGSGVDSPVKINQEVPYQLSRNYEGPVEERERFNAHIHDIQLPSADIRAISEQYKGLSPPSGMFYAPNARIMLSPPLSSRSHSPRESLPRSSPGINPELLPKSPFHQLALDKRTIVNSSAAEHARMMEHSRELHRSVSDHQRGITEHQRVITEHPRGITEHQRGITEQHRAAAEVARKSALSPREAMHAMQYARVHELENFHNRSRYNTPPGHRSENMSHNEAILRNEVPTRSIYDHRGEEISNRERYLHQNAALSQVYRGSSPPPTSQVHHSTNLVLGRADGAIIGPLSSYENRQSPYEVRQPEHKR